MESPRGAGSLFAMFGLIALIAHLRLTEHGLARVARSLAGAGPGGCKGGETLEAGVRPVPAALIATPFATLRIADSFGSIVPESFGIGHAGPTFQDHTPGKSGVLTASTAGNDAEIRATYRSAGVGAH